MANETVLQLPTVLAATASDIIYAVQGGNDVQETLQQILDLTQEYTVLTNAGNPNGSLAGNDRQLCYDTSNSKFYICTTSGSSTTAVWTLIGANIVAPNQGGLGIASPTANTIPIANGSSNFNFQALTNGQLLVGSTGAAPVAAQITAGANISITNAAGSITIAATGGVGFSWNEVTSATQAMDVRNGYMINRPAGCTLTLPVTSAFADTIEVVNYDGQFTIAQNAGQSITFNGVTSTVGVGGSVTSINNGQSLTLFCAVADLEWIILAPGAAFTIV